MNAYDDALALLWARSRPCDECGASVVDTYDLDGRHVPIAATSDPLGMLAIVAWGTRLWVAPITNPGDYDHDAAQLRVKEHRHAQP